MAAGMVSVVRGLGVFHWALAVLGAVPELFGVEENLRTCAEDELSAAINTHQIPINIGHDPSRKLRKR